MKLSWIPNVMRDEINFLYYAIFKYDEKITHFFLRDDDDDEKSRFI